MGARQFTGAARIGVVGAGAMGRGIVQLFAAAGQPVSLHDMQPAAAEAGVAHVVSMLDRSVEKGRLSAEAAATAKACLRVATDLQDLSDCDVVVEAIVENLVAKQALFVALEDVVSPDAILATNTSSLIVSEIAAPCRRPERIAGLHFFNPVPLMKVAEVIAAVRTSAETLETLRALVEGAGHRAVSALDQPGFLVNHAGRGLYTEGLAILEEGAASHVQIDELLRDAAGFRMGPFELFDLTGLDVSGQVLKSIFEQFQYEPRFRPSALIPPRMAAGLHGRKTGRGWYDYGAVTAPVEDPVVPGPSADLRVWIDREADRRDALAALVAQSGATVSFDPSPKDVLLVISPWGSDATRHCAARGLDPTRCVAIDPLPALDKRRTLMLTAATRPEMRDAGVAVFGSTGVPVTVIGDSPGFVIQRVLATIVNIATGIAQRGIAPVADIEDAVRLGLGYPKGPLAWGDEIGPGRVLEILRNLSAATGDPRYRPTLWLRRRAELGLSLLTPDPPR